MYIKRNESNDEVWLLPFTYIPDQIGIELYQNLTDEDEALEPYFIEVKS